MSYTCETRNVHAVTCCHWVVRERNSSIYPTSTVAFKFARILLITVCGEYTAKEGVRNTHQWFSRNKTGSAIEKSGGDIHYEHFLTFVIVVQF